MLLHVELYSEGVLRMENTLDPGRLFIAMNMFSSTCGADLRKIITRALKDKFGYTADEIYNGVALDIVESGPLGIIDCLPEVQSEALIEALVVFANLCIVLKDATAEQNIRIIFKQGTFLAARGLLGTHGFLFIISPEDQRKLACLGETEEERTVTVTVRENNASWRCLILQLMGYIEKIEKVN